MNRALFTNTALTTLGKPRYDVLFHNQIQDPEEVAKSKRYSIERESSQTNNVTDNTPHKDFVDLIERDWEYGKKAFVVTYGILVTSNPNTGKKNLHFAGYWL